MYGVTWGARSVAIVEKQNQKPCELAAECEIVEGEGCGHSPLMANMFASA